MIDNLINRITELNSPIVVGLDPTISMVPERIVKKSREEYKCPLNAVSKALVKFNREIIDAVYDIVPAVKPQIAMYERFGNAGVKAYIETINYAKEKGLIIIGDIKRGDIASTAEAYASHIGGVEVFGDKFDPWQEDFVTLNPYLGGDSITPFTDICETQEKGLFILVKTSNAGSGDLQDLELKSGLSVYEHMADMVSSWGKNLIGKHGYSKVGAVVGATHPAQGQNLRNRMPNTFFLVPGYGAQGGSGKDLQGFFDTNGIGCIVNSSRGITAAWQKDSCFGENNVGDAAREAVIAMKKDLNENLK
ncbi:MAG: orotidine-5'-phosphate decarboxylase [Defluviitaleaceae bacterium]|nr:orotidine-5'-phosphate decarboxylase [Defluviitaleaceae bacterium]